MGDRTKSLVIAVHTGLAPGAAEAAESDSISLDNGIRQNGNLQLALAIREIIGQARGILMERERLSAI
jgi:hypothetical protein